MVKSKRSKFPISGSISSLDEFPVELLLLIFKELDIPTLLKVCNVCKRFQQISSKMLFNKFKEPNVGILLTFEQEYKWKSYIHFEISKYNEQTGKFIFKPKSKQPMRFINSPMVRNPILSKISISGLNNKNHLPFKTTSTTTATTTATTTPSPTPTPITIVPSSTSPNNSLKVAVNLLQKPLSLNIKSHEETINKVQHVYRIGHGTSHLRIPYRFIYSITDTPPPSVNKTRGGERWLTPISFECSPSFFYPSEPIAHKIIMTIIHLRKRNLHKKKSPSPSPSINKQKQRIIDFDEVLEDDYISIEFMNDHNNMRNRRLLERQMSHQEQQDHHSSYFRRKFKWGARS
ncbi:hypothetical protein C1646_725035 [Rhizophagus diaphanus]|nr:hypothetical protein C1646_725035 [Rhizophagus diaphanus] [Rhizophagus sp. MUCL 43196]